MLPIKQSSNLPATIKQSRNPLSILTSRYKKFISTTSFRMYYCERNEPRVISPFLRGICADFSVVGHYIMVKESTAISTKLSDLNFLQLTDVLDQHSISLTDNQFRHLTPNIARYYNYEYNIELYIIASCNWDAIRSASIISHNIRMDQDIIATFLSVYSSLLTIENHQ